MPASLTILAPLALLLSDVLGGGAPRTDDPAPRWQAAESAPTAHSVAGGVPLLPLADGFRVPTLNQVRIEQRVVIRVSPRAGNDILSALPEGPMSSRYRERRMGRCVPLSGIAGVQIGDDDKLLLFMRDQRLIGAELDAACSARDFYSGFYVERSTDGRLCVDRDTLHSRAGANCSLSRMRELIALED